MQHHTTTVTVAPPTVRSVVLLALGLMMVAGAGLVAVADLASSMSSADTDAVYSMAVAMLAAGILMAREAYRPRYVHLMHDPEWYNHLCHDDTATATAADAGTLSRESASLSI